MPSDSNRAPDPGAAHRPERRRPCVDGRVELHRREHPVEQTKRGPLQLGHDRRERCPRRIPGGRATHSGDARVPADRRGGVTGDLPHRGPRPVTRDVADAEPCRGPRRRRSGLPGLLTCRHPARQPRCPDRRAPCSKSVTPHRPSDAASARQRLERGLQRLDREHRLEGPQLLRGPVMAGRREPPRGVLADQPIHRHPRAHLVESVARRPNRAREVGTQALAAGVRKAVVERRAERPDRRADARRLVAVRLTGDVADPLHRTPALVGRRMGAVGKRVVGTHDRSLGRAGGRADRWVVGPASDFRGCRREVKTRD